ncbi:MAG: phosphotransferase family protein [Bradymonadaceae bacterium]|nr:phosphotransferase family protein [Lujinxingiaceae bacterium]
MIDAPANPRHGEELDEDKLLAYLSEALDVHASALDIQQFPSGHSNLTYLVRVPGGDQWVLRRPPHGAQVKSGHDMVREFRILSALSPHVAWVPHPVALCEDERVLGAPFYLMERVEGYILRGSNPQLSGLDEAMWRRLSQTCVETLVAIHGVDYVDVGLGELGHPQGYVERQVQGWSARYKQAETDAISEMDQVATWLEANRPSEAGAALIHNDYKYDNLVLDPEDITLVRAVLDWEMATIGDPLMDLGTSLAYWVEAGDDPILRRLALSPTFQPGNFTRTELVEYYATASGRDLSNIAFYYAFGLFKVAIIGQQIYYRFAKGHTQDPRFGGLIHAVRALAKAAWRVAQTGRIDAP